MPGHIQSEGKRIKACLENGLPTKWEGRSTILELKDADYMWRQMEWIGWYFEYKARSVLIDALGGDLGPSFGRTVFDYQREFVWDFKAHPLNAGHWAIMNDCEAVNACIESFSGNGFVVAVGIAEYDDGTFKQWHDALKGGQSEYELKRIQRQAPSRSRKTSFEISDYMTIFFEDRSSLERAIREGWMSGDAQVGWRNSNGRPRRAKYKINTGAIPDWCKIV